MQDFFTILFSGIFITFVYIVAQSTMLMRCRNMVRKAYPSVGAHDWAWASLKWWSRTQLKRWYIRNVGLHIEDFFFNRKKKKVNALLDSMALSEWDRASLLNELVDAMKQDNPAIYLGEDTAFAQGCSDDAHCGTDFEDLAFVAPELRYIPIGPALASFKTDKVEGK